MKSFLIAMAFLTAQSTAYAQSGQGATALYEAGSDRGQKPVAGSPSPRTLNGVLHSANDCAPDVATPMWSPTAVLLGYACSHNENGG